MKKTFTNPEMQLVAFESTDIIRTSAEAVTTPDPDQGEWDQIG